ncbi:MAG: radical SAM protein [Atopobiaceae bacterium]|nr:radical SAM protein [Atopobiaceae bacterium]
MSTFYRLKKDILLRGWDKLPFVVIDARTKKLDSVSKSMMSTLRMCDGSWDFDSIFCSGEHAQNAAKLLKQNIIEACEEGNTIAPEQEYHLDPNRFMQTIHWSLTGRCNYRCKHCFMSAPEARYGELSHETMIGIARQIGECGIPRVSLTGGEPLIRRDFLDIAAELTRQNVAITQLYTNGKLLTPEILDGLTKLHQHPTVIMSFDGVGWHDWQRGVPGAEAAANAAFELCASKGFRAHAQMTLHKDNVHTLRDTVNHLAAIGCGSMRVARVNDSGDWLSNGQGLTLSSDEYREAILDYIPHYYEDGMPLHIILLGMFSASPDEPNRYNLTPCREGCDDPNRSILFCARLTMQLYADGRPAICDELGPDFVGGLPVASDDPAAATMPLREQLTTGSPYLNLLDRRSKEIFEANPTCVACPYLRYCGGGCRAMAHQAGGTIIDRDLDTCGFFNDGWARKVMETVSRAQPEARSPYSDNPLFI